MRFQVLSHAGLSVQAAGKQLISDPWLVGTCFWRSWWNYPPVSEELVASLKPDWIYLTHVHWDHFQGPSLRRFPKDTQILLPYERSPRVRADLEAMGYKNIRELTHGKTITLAPGFNVTSYQFSSPYGDSALVVEADGATLLNANDTKFVGGPLKQILKRHGPIDFAFRSHSSANDRVCLHYTDTDQTDAERFYEDPELYITNFVNFMKKVKPRYAIPFASNHCHLHRDVYPLNSYVMNPSLVKDYVDKNDPLPTGTKLQLMVSGDSWDSEKGFDISEHTYFTDRDAHVERLLEENTEVLEKYYAKEDRTTVKLKDFERFFGKFNNGIPGFFKKKLKDKPIIFRAVNSNSRFCVEVDVYNDTIREIEESSIGQDAIIYEAPTIVMKSALVLNMFSHAGISKRVNYYCRKQDEPTLRMYTRMLECWEYDVLPLSKLFSMRTVRSYWPRWRELLFYAQAAMMMMRGKTARDVEQKFLS
jgi:UDP-MurNAc hydroxylase